MTRKPIYMDYNATTPVDTVVVNEMLPYLNEYFGNASSSHSYGNTARVGLERARERVAQSICCSIQEIVFTSGGTESNNLAIIGTARARHGMGIHIITSTVEHPSVLEPCRYLESQGFEITYLPVDRYGQVSVEEFKKAIRDDTILASIMHANNEVGTIQPINEISAITREKNIYLHVDAAQSFGKIAVNVDKLGADLLTLAGHKFYAPKGVGSLYVRKGVSIENISFGAQHEHGLRPGTEAIHNVVALGKACQIASESLDRVSSMMLRLRQRLHELFISDVPEIALNGHPTSRLPNTLNLGFPNVLAADLLAETAEIAASAGSACHADSILLSPVLTAMGIDEITARGSIRLSLGKWTTEADVDEAEDLLSTSYRKLLERSS